MARPSHVRDAVSELIESSSRHAWTVDDTHAELRSRGVGADPSSVYRALVRLSERGELLRFEVGDGRSRFERHVSHHEHIVCSDCGEVAAIPGCLVGSIADEVARRTGFTVGSHKLTFSGRCQACAGAA